MQAACAADADLAEAIRQRNQATVALKDGAACRACWNCHPLPSKPDTHEKAPTSGSDKVQHKSSGGQLISTAQRIVTLVNDEWVVQLPAGATLSRLESAWNEHVQLFRDAVQADEVRMSMCAMRQLVKIASQFGVDRNGHLRPAFPATANDITKRCDSAAHPYSRPVRSGQAAAGAAVDFSLNDDVLPMMALATAVWKEVRIGAGCTTVLPEHTPLFAPLLSDGAHLPELRDAVDQLQRTSNRLDQDRFDHVEKCSKRVLHTLEEASRTRWPGVISQMRMLAEFVTLQALLPEQFQWRITEDADNLLFQQLVEVGLAAKLADKNAKMFQTARIAKLAEKLKDAATAASVPGCITNSTLLDLHLLNCLCNTAMHFPLSPRHALDKNFIKQLTDGSDLAKQLTPGDNIDTVEQLRLTYLASEVTDDWTVQLLTFMVRVCSRILEAFQRS